MSQRATDELGSRYIQILKGKTMAKSTNRNEKRGPVPHKILSDRGVHLDKTHRMSQSNNINHGMTAFSFLKDNGDCVFVKVGEKCPICKKSVRGINHENGDHHKRIPAR